MYITDEHILITTNYIRPFTQLDMCSAWLLAQALIYGWVYATNCYIEVLDYEILYLFINYNIYIFIYHMFKFCYQYYYVLIMIGIYLWSHFTDI